MIQSMTSYARRDINAEWGNATWEVKSVNKRYLEIYFCIPEQFRSLEQIIKKHISSCIFRGKIECSLTFYPYSTEQKNFIINEILVKQLIDAVELIKINTYKKYKFYINPFDILKWPGVIEFKKIDIDFISRNLLTEFYTLIDDFIVTRKKEGKTLKFFLEKRLKGILIEIEKIKNLFPEILQFQREQLKSKFKNLILQLDNNRLEQEFILMAQRIDITEELDRLEAHVKETYNILNINKKEAVGRRLDFMMQELNRESNTLASKSINTNITNSAIELKVLIEQMREQIQNIE